MLWKRGWILDSLRYRAEKDIRETLYRNEVFLNNRWSFLERLIVWGSKHLRLSIFLLLTIAIFISFAVSTNYELLKEHIPASINGVRPILDFQSSLFGAQVTFLGLIFPLVIAFVGVLLQGKSSNKSLWLVYRYNSGFMLVGFSAITFTAFFISSKMLEPWLTHKDVTAVAVSTITWFFINLFLSGWFLWKTVQFLELEHRMEMVVKYAISEVIVADIKRRLLTNYCAAASGTGLLPTSKEDFFNIESFCVTEFPNQILKQHSQPKYIVNVWYRLLRLGIWFWTIQAHLARESNKVPELCFPFEVNGYKSKKIVLAQSSISFGFFTKFLILQSIRLSKKSEKITLDVNQMVAALFGQVEDALKENNIRLFEAAKNDLVHFYKEIESSMHFINDKGKPDNWILLSEGTWLGRSFLDVFVRETIGIAKAITRRIPEDASFYESWSYLYPRLYSGYHEDIPKKIADAYIDGHYFIWGSLMSWMGGYHSSGLLANQQRDRAIKHFVGSWEHWRHLINKDFSSVSQVSFESAMRHLNNTSRMIIYATKYENWDASRWATDVFVYWFELFSNNQLDYRYYRSHHELITPNILKLDAEHKLRIAISTPDDFKESVATSMALRNYWTDIRCLTVAYLIGAPQYKVVAHYKKYVEAILSGKRLESTDGLESDHNKPLTNAKDVLSVYLRQNGCWDEQQAYNAMLEQHVEELSRIEEPEWVSGRGYLSTGTKQELYLPRFFKAAGVGLTKAEFMLDTKWSDFLKSDAISQGELENTISELQKLTSVDDTLLDTICYQFDIEREVAEQRRDLFIKSINAIIVDLKAEIASQIINTPLDQNRLERFGVAASSSTFTLLEGPMPISLFQDIDYLDDFPAALVKTDFDNYPRSEVSEGLEVNRAINEEESLNRIIQQRSVIEVFHQLFRNLTWQSTQHDDSTELVSKVVENGKLIRNEGLTPIMFVGPWSVYQLIDRAKWPYSREEEKLPFDIATESGKEDTYICHLNDIEIHRLPLRNSDFSVLLPKEAFKKIKVKRFGDGRYVDATFTPKNDTDLTGTLTLTFGIECEFQAKKCFEYISLHPDED